MTDKNKHDKVKKLKASITVEASLCIPIFFIVLFSFFYQFNVLFEVNKNHVQLAEAAADYAVYGTKTDTFVSALKQGDIIRWSESDGYKICYMKYGKKNPFLMNVFDKQRFYQRIVISGYEGKSMCQSTQDSEETVYIAENGTVYHVYSDCTYLNPSIQRVLSAEIDKKRNSSGGKYKKCEFCHRTKNSLEKYVYITNYGDRYHLEKKCHGIKRTIRKVKISEAGGMPECSKCRERG